MQKKFGKVEYIKALKSWKPIVICTGPPGTGKTMYACKQAEKYMKNKTFDKFIVTRPMIGVDENIGYLPGTMEQKFDPWIGPIYDNTDSKLDFDIAPLAFMRGRTFKNSFVIADEMQNSTVNQIKTLLTRVGDGSKMIITGDLGQSDLKTTNGLHFLLEKLDSYESQLQYVEYVQMKKQDIKRHECIEEILDIFDS